MSDIFILHPVQDPCMAVRPVVGITLVKNQ